MKLSLKTEIIPIMILAAVIISSFYFFALFPEKVAVHWNAAGQPDNWSPRAVAAFVLPVVLIVVYALFLFLPNIDPKKKKYKEFAKIYHIFKGLIMFFLGALYMINSLKNIGYNISIEIVVPILIGVMFVVMGKYMSEIKTNWFLGIRTPWTLSSDKVWERTHHVGGKIFMISGVLMALAGFLPVAYRLPVFFTVLIIMLLSTVFYSYFAYRKLNK